MKLMSKVLKELYDDRKKKNEDRSWNVVFSAPHSSLSELRQYTIKHKGLTQDEAYNMSENLRKQHLKTMEQRIIYGFHPVHDRELPTSAKDTGKYIGL